VLACFSYGFFNPGLEEGPPALADALLGPGTPRVDVPFAPGLGDDAALRRGLPLVAAAVRESTDPPTLAILGECTIAPAVLAGVQQRLATRSVGCIWVDAHGDLNTPETSPSGIIGGMGLAAICGRWSDSWLQVASGVEPIPPELAVLVGARELDPGEADFVASSRINVADDVRGAIRMLPPDVPLHLHLDLDVMDVAVNPAIDLPVAGGWGAEKVRDGVAAVVETGRAAAISVMWGIPARDTPDGVGLRACVDALEPLLHG
jgi:arginase